VVTERDSQLLRDIHERVVRLDERGVSNATRIMDLEHTVFGNGQPGLKVWVDRLIVFMTSAKSIIGILGVAVITLLGRWFYEAILRN
jgi:hypothetical protein